MTPRLHRCLEEQFLLEESPLIEAIGREWKGTENNVLSELNRASSGMIQLLRRRGDTHVLLAPLEKLCQNELQPISEKRCHLLKS